VNGATPGRGNGILRVGAVAATLLCVVAVLPDRAAANGTWTIQPTPNPAGGNALQGVSCSTATTCTAVGEACSAGGADACMPGVTGSQATLAERWEGTGWATQAMPSVSGYNVLAGVACPTAADCVAVGFDYDINKQLLVTLAEWWNGSSWSAQHTPSRSGANSYLEAISCTSTTSCTAVGYSLDSAGVERTLAERWDGSSWSIQTTPNRSGMQNSVLRSVSCASASACTAVGRSDNGGGASVTLAEAWNGSTWTLQTTTNPNGNGELMSASCTAASSCFAAGDYAGSGATLGLVERWNGTTWSVAATLDPSASTATYLQGVSCTTSSSCTAAGYYVNASGSEVPLEVELTAKAWQLLAIPSPSGAADAELSGLSCATATRCSAVGYYADSQGATYTLAEGGGSWVILPSPNPSGAAGSTLNGVSCASVKACVAVGDSFDSGGVESALAEQWNGSKWSMIKTATPANTASDGLSSVSCTSATLCTAVGWYLDGSSGIALTLAERWNGTSWKIQPSPSPAGATSSILLGVSCASAGACVAVGDYHNGSGQPIAFAETWNGSAWVVQAANPNGALESYLLGISCPSATSCTAVGTYVDSSGNQLGLVEYWNGSSWLQITAGTPFGSTQITLQGVACTSAKVCTAVGYYDNFGTDETLAEAWHGGGWAVLSTPAAGAQGSALTGVSCPSTSACTAVGDGVDNSGFELPAAIGWDGHAWTYQPTPFPKGAQQNYLEAVACASPVACFAVGATTDSSGTQRTLVER
jgi:hypothetical protein